jgi:hypothetical protein
MWVLLLSSATLAAPADAGTAEQKTAITSAMRLNFAALMTLQSYLTSSAPFADPANASECA